MRHRFQSICPYFAMFPEEFAQEWIETCTKPGQMVADPFSGRGTAPFQAILNKRNAIAGDVNPVAYVLTGAKIDSPRLPSVLRRLTTLQEEFDPSKWEDQRSQLSPFFRRAFFHSTLSELLHLQSCLDWRSSRVDRFIAALVLGSLHGEMFTSSSYFSNQMPRTISTKPAYSLRYWQKHDLWPRRRDVFAILRQRAAYRFESEAPSQRGVAHLCDVRDLSYSAKDYRGEVNCVITSPPYLDVTNFEEDQWLRLWFLGGSNHPTRGMYSRDDRHEREDKYWAFLCDAWRGLRPMLAKRSSFVCRIGGKNVSVQSVKQALCASMQFLAKDWELVSYKVSNLKRRQTDSFRPGTVGCRFEIDFHFALVQ
jgi:hypothetical protein